MCACARSCRGPAPISGVVDPFLRDRRWRVHARVSWSCPIGHGGHSCEFFRVALLLLSCAIAARSVGSCVAVSRSFGIMSLSRACFACFVASARATIVQSVGEGVPVVDLSLAAPEAPSELVAAIADLDLTRGDVEKSVGATDMVAFNAALRTAKPRIDEVAKHAVRAVVGDRRVASGSSFLAAVAIGGRARGGGEVVDVEVSAGKPADMSAAVAAVRELEGVRERGAKFGQFTADFDALTTFVIEQVGLLTGPALVDSGRTAASFLNPFADRGVAAIANFALRGAIGDDLIRAEHLALSVAFLRRANEMLREALRKEVAIARGGATSFFGAAAKAGFANSDKFDITLVPPPEDAADTLARIDELLLGERAKQSEANVAFAGEKQRALDAVKSQLRKAARISLR